MLEVMKFIAGNSAEITLRLAEPDDSAEIISSVRSSSPERSYVLMEQYGNNVESEKKFISNLGRDNNLLLVALADGVIIGSLAALQATGRFGNDSSHILNIGLHLKEAYRGLGVGSRMLEYAVQWAGERGFKKLAAKIFTTNNRSLHMFSKAGFTQECIKKKQICVGNEYIDEVCMARFLE